jgi:AraC-like DNA-binding protein
MNEIRVEDFNIKLLRCYYFDGSKLKNTKFAKRIVYDYEIEYYTFSEGGIEIDNKFTKFEAGSVNFRRPGQVVRGIPPYSAYFISFDILGLKEIDSKYVFGNKESSQQNYSNEILNNIGNKVVFGKYNDIEKLFRRIYNNHLLKNEFASLEIKADLYLLIKKLYENNKNKKINVIVRKGLEYIEKNIYNEIRIQDISNSIGVSANYFQAIFKNTMNITPNNYILRLRLNKAKYLLSTTNMTIADIGLECGFFDNVYFSYVFKKNEGIQPNAYRKNFN